MMVILSSIIFLSNGKNDTTKMDLWDFPLKNPDFEVLAGESPLKPQNLEVYHGNLH
jgi:hypothetical protein